MNASVCLVLTGRENTWKRVLWSHPFPFWFSSELHELHSLLHLCFLSKQKSRTTKTELRHRSRICVMDWSASLSITRLAQCPDSFQAPKTANFVYPLHDLQKKICSESEGTQNTTFIGHLMLLKIQEKHNGKGMKQQKTEQATGCRQCEVRTSWVSHSRGVFTSEMRVSCTHFPVIINTGYPLSMCWQRISPWHFELLNCQMQGFCFASHQCVCVRLCLHRVRCFHQRSCLRCDAEGCVTMSWCRDWPLVDSCVAHASNCVGECNAPGVFRS